MVTGINRQKRFSKEEWFEIESEIENTTDSIKSISDKFNLSPNSVFLHFKKTKIDILHRKPKHKPSIRKLFRSIKKDIDRKIQKSWKSSERQQISKYKCECGKSATGFFQGKPLCRDCYRFSYLHFRNIRFTKCLNPNCNFLIQIFPKSKFINLICPECSSLVRKQQELKSIC